MKAVPTGPFWIWTDIEGSGMDWHLAHVTPGNHEIHYPLDDFDDFFWPEEEDATNIRLIRKPKPKEE